MFRKDLDVIDALRRDAVNVQEPHQSGIKKLQAYAAQLAWMSGKFPIDVRLLPCQKKKKSNLPRTPTHSFPL